MKLSKTHLNEIGPSGGFLGRLLLKTIIKNWIAFNRKCN